MKRITFRADENLIKKAHSVARFRRMTLTTAFREWLENYAAQKPQGPSIDRLMRRLSHLRSTGPFTREEMNKRRG
jgi:hypothetical protein